MMLVGVLLVLSVRFIFCWCCGMTGDIYYHLDRKFDHYNVQDTRHYDQETDTWTSVEYDYDSDDDD